LYSGSSTARRKSRSANSSTPDRSKPHARTPCDRLARPCEQGGELAAGELGAHIGAVPGLVEEMRVGVQGHAGAGVAEDVAHLEDVEADVDDQVAGEGVAEVVEAHPPPVNIEARVDGRPP